MGEVPKSPVTLKCWIWIGTSCYFHNRHKNIIFKNFPGTEQKSATDSPWYCHCVVALIPKVLWLLSWHAVAKNLFHGPQFIQVTSTSFSHNSTLPFSTLPHRMDKLFQGWFRWVATRKIHSVYVVNMALHFTLSAFNTHSLKQKKTWMARRNVDQSCKSNLHVSKMVKCYIKMFTFVAFILFSKLALSNCEVTTDDMRKYR